MTTLQRRLFLALILLALPGSVAAQAIQASGLDFFIGGFAAVNSAGVVLDLGSAVQETVVYETNRVDQKVFVRVEGDLTGLELRIAPFTEQQHVLGAATSGETGHATPLTFRQAGELALVTGVTGAGVELPVSYTVVALDPAARKRVADIRISYSIN